MSDWAVSEERKVAEAEALRMWPKNYHMGRWDGIIPQAEVDNRMAIQRRAYVMGEQAAFERARKEEYEYAVKVRTFGIVPAYSEGDARHKLNDVRYQTGKVVRRRKAGDWEDVPAQEHDHRMGVSCPVCGHTTPRRAVLS